MRKKTLCALMVALGLFVPTLQAAEQSPLVVFLVRHAEKADRGKDPELSAAGRERASALATILRSVDIEHVHSSDFIRTRATAEPTATEYGLKVELYDPRDLPALADKLKRAGGRHLVVGHSDTTPIMVALLGGKPGPPIDEKAEYDRLYIVTVGDDGAAVTVTMRYGEPYRPTEE